MSEDRKMCYWMEYPDWDRVIVVLHDGPDATPHIMTAKPENRDGDGWGSMLRDFHRQGYEVHAFTSDMYDNDGELSRQYRRWRPIEREAFVS